MMESKEREINTRMKLFELNELSLEQAKKIVFDYTNRYEQSDQLDAAVDFLLNNKTAGKGNHVDKQRKVNVVADQKAC